MDAVLDALGELILKALPTLILLILLHIYLRWMFYRPMDRLLQERWEATDGARKAADEALARAERKAAEYEEALRQARLELAAEQEKARQRLQAEQSVALSEARAGTDTMVQEARASLAREADEARKDLETEAERLAGEIVSAILERSAK